MIKARRPCIEPGCNQLAEPGQSRCRADLRIEGQAKNNRRAALAPAHGAGRQLRHKINSQGWAHCRTCGGRFDAADIEVDHIVPLEDGGKDHHANVQPLCRPCHLPKSIEENRQRRIRRHTAGRS